MAGTRENRAVLSQDIDRPDRLPLQGDVQRGVVGEGEENIAGILLLELADFYPPAPILPGGIPGVAPGEAVAIEILPPLGVDDVPGPDGALVHGLPGGGGEDQSWPTRRGWRQGSGGFHASRSA